MSQPIFKTKNLKFYSANMNHGVVEIKITGNEAPKAKDLLFYAKSCFPNLKFHKPIQKFVDMTFNSWFRYGECEYRVGFKLHHQIT